MKSFGRCTKTNRLTRSVCPWWPHARQCLLQLLRQISEHVERLVNFLKRPEGPGTEDDAPSAAIENVEEEDDEDSRIEEI